MYVNGVGEDKRVHMYRILLPLDDDIDRATSQANYVTSLPCAESGVEVILAHAMTGEERTASVEIKQVDRIETVQRVQSILEDSGVESETRELSGPPADGILAFVENEDVDEVVMGGRKRSPTEKAILGSITQTVILNADVPVTVTAADE